MGAEKKGKLELAAKGPGGVKECCAQFSDSAVQYCWLRLNRTDDGGDSKRVKFVLLAWVGEVSTDSAQPPAPGCTFPPPSRERLLAALLRFAAQRATQNAAALRCTALLCTLPLGSSVSHCSSKL